jgi:hypothetical protein
MSGIQVVSGGAFDYRNPRPQDIHIEDVAHALGNICRFGGHTLRFYSVAEHSVLVSSIAPPHLALQALLHDAAEAFIGDMPRPLKTLLPEYRVVEARVWRAVAERFGLPETLDPLIHELDNRVLLAEKAALLRQPAPVSWAWADGLEPADVTVRAYPPTTASLVFLDRYRRLSAAGPANCAESENG